MALVHLVFQGKGGVGKSLVASFLAQYILDSQKDESRLLAIDADPVNSSFANFSRFRAHTIDLLSGDALNISGVNRVIDAVLGHSGDVVIDIGPGLFIPLGNHLAEGSVLRLLESRGWSVMVHSVVVGGPAQRDTLEGLAQTIRSLPLAARIVVWLNEYFGLIIGPEGQSFKDMRIYTTNMDRYAGVVHLPKQAVDTFEFDLRQMLEKRQTFAEALTDGKVGLMPRHRLTTMRRNLYRHLDNILPAGQLMDRDG